MTPSAVLAENRLEYAGTALSPTALPGHAFFILTKHFLVCLQFIFIFWRIPTAERLLTGWGVKGQRSQEIKKIWCRNRLYTQFLELIGDIGGSGRTCLVDPILEKTGISAQERSDKEFVW